MGKEKFSQNKGLIIFEMVVYGTILVWFLTAFLPLGLN